MTLAERAAAEAMQRRLSEYLSYGVAQRSTGKAEDFYATVVDDQKERAVCAVFDSHGGKGAGRRAAETLPERLMQLTSPSSFGHDAYPEKHLVDQFWRADREMGEAKIFSGSTATRCSAYSAVQKSPSCGSTTHTDRGPSPSS